MNNENLAGSLVLVRPDFETDSGQKRGQVGILTYPREAKEMFVSFPDGAEGTYTSENLFKLKDKQDIYQALMKNGSSMDLNDYKAMYKIMLLQDRGTSKATYDALELARDNPGVWDKVLDQVAKIQTVNLQKTYSR